MLISALTINPDKPLKKSKNKRVFLFCFVFCLSFCFVFVCLFLFCFVLIFVCFCFVLFLNIEVTYLKQNFQKHYIVLWTHNSWLPFSRVSMVCPISHCVQMFHFCLHVYVFTFFFSLLFHSLILGKCLLSRYPFKLYYHKNEMWCLH